jgi:hypothetical protein
MYNSSFLIKLGFEALIIFSSVIGAFLVEDFRHEKQEYEDYVSTLKSFRKDLESDLKYFLFDAYLDSVLTGTPLINKEREDDTDLALELLSNKSTIPRFVELLAKDSLEFSKSTTFWIPSRSATEIYKYNAFLSDDIVIKSIYGYNRMFTLGDLANNKLEKNLNLLLDLLTGLDYQNPRNKTNIDFLHNNYEVLNAIKRYKASVGELKSANDNLIAATYRISQSVDQALVRHGVDISAHKSNIVEQAISYISSSSSMNISANGDLLVNHNSADEMCKNCHIL